jgi:protein-S-isoprenylcysteine O-methyltransferase Ste14
MDTMMLNAQRSRALNSKPVVRLRYFIPYLLIFLLVPIGTFIGGTWFDIILHLPPFPPFPFNIILGIAVMLGGAAIGIKATRQLHAVGKGLPWGEAEAQSQSSVLLTTGIYAYTRNPMTFGYTLLPLGMGLLFRSLGIALFIPAIVLTVQLIIIKGREEPSLERRFGEDYLEYKRKTPFLIPNVRLFFTYHRKRNETTSLASD